MNLEGQSTLRAVLDALTARGEATLSELAAEGLSTYRGTCIALYELRKRGLVDPPVKDRQGRFYGGPVTYRPRTGPRRLRRWARDPRRRRKGRRLTPRDLGV